MVENENLNKNTVQAFDKFAVEYDQKYETYQPYIQTYEKLAGYLPKGRVCSVLDVACGPAHASKYLVNEGFELEVFGFDLSVNMLRIARKNVPMGRFQQMDCRNLDSLNSTYDIVICGFCLPYLDLRSCSKLLKDLADALKPGGIAYISAIEGENYFVEENISSSGDFLRIHHQPVAVLLPEFSELGLQVIDVERKAIVTATGAENIEVFFYLRNGSHESLTADV